MRNRYPALRPVFLIATFLSSTVLVAGIPATAEEAEKAPQSVSVFDKAQLQVPAEFERTQPASRIVQHEFKVGQGETTARLTMMAAGGSVDDNIKRWKGQFSGGDEAAQKSEKMDIGKWTVHIVDVSGAYAERMGGGPFAGGKVVQRENYAMAGAIMIEPEGRQFFIKMIGPADVVKANREKFVAMVKSIGQ